MKSVESRGDTLRELRTALKHGSPPHKLSNKRFDEAHELFEGASNQQQLILQWLQELIGSNYANADPLKVLSVGCGSGILDNPLIHAIAGRAKRVEYTGVDPNPVACQRFRDEFHEQQQGNVRLRLREQDIESLAPDEEFHAIHLVHSLYYFKDPAHTLDVLLNWLAPEGILAIVLAPEAELNRLAKCFWTHHEEGGIWFSHCLEEHLLSRRLAFSRHRIDGKVDVSPCFEADCPRGQMIIDFITQTACRQLDDDVIQLCLSYLRGVSRREHGNWLVAHPADAFVIARPAPTG